MSIFEYDQEKHIRMERQEAWEEGEEHERRKTIMRMLKKGFAETQIMELCDTTKEEIETCRKSL